MVLLTVDTPLSIFSTVFLSFSRVHIKTALFLFLLFIYSLIHSATDSVTDNFGEVSTAQKCLCTIVFSGCYNSFHLLFVPPFPVVRNISEIQCGKEMRSCTAVLCCAALSFSSCFLLCSIHFSRKMAKC